MWTTFGALLAQHSENHAQNPQYVSSTNKDWAKEFAPIRTMYVHCSSANGIFQANFERALIPEQPDDAQRKAMLAFPPNRRSWRLQTEADISSWFHHEVSNIVLAAWADQPRVIQQAEINPLSMETVRETVDFMYSMKTQEGDRIPVISGEMKRNLIDARRWMGGRLPQGPQSLLSQELRGYAYKYSCPQVFCFDGQTLLLLQFCATTREMIASPQCEVDCWVVPSENRGGCTLRYALYRFLVQGLRRCQGNHFANPELRINGETPMYRYFFSGEPTWSVDGGTSQLTKSPSACYRAFDLRYGVWVWLRGGQTLVDSNGSVVFDTKPLLTQ